MEPIDFSTYTSPIHTVSLDNGQVVVNKLFANWLNHFGYKSFDNIFRLTDGELIKKESGLEIRKTCFNGVNFFVKKHWQPKSCLKSQSMGQIEFNEYVSFRSNGLATPIAIAFGEKIEESTLHSFFITQDFSPLVDLEELVLNQPDFFRGNANLKRRQNVLSAIGKYARKMHDAGCNQKDFNATHILLADYDTDAPKVALFDLERVDRNLWQQFRWPVKALGELFFTLPEDQFNIDSYLFLFKSYLRKEHLNFWDQILFRWILAKKKRISRHSKKWNLAPKMDN